MRLDFRSPPAMCTTNGLSSAWRGDLGGVRPRLLCRIVIPSLVKGDLSAGQALRLWPLERAAWADASGPEGVPDRAARRHAFPAIFRTRPPLAHRAVDVSVFFQSIPPRHTLRAATSVGGWPIQSRHSSMSLRDAASIFAQPLMEEYAMAATTWSHPGEISHQWENKWGTYGNGRLTDRNVRRLHSQQRLQNRPPHPTRQLASG